MKLIIIIFALLLANPASAMSQREYELQEQFIKLGLSRIFEEITQEQFCNRYRLLFKQAEVQGLKNRPWMRPNVELANKNKCSSTGA